MGRAGERREKGGKTKVKARSGGVSAGEGGSSPLPPPGPDLLLGRRPAVFRQSHGALRRDKVWKLHVQAGTAYTPGQKAREKLRLWNVSGTLSV